ncbi:hypothetical protein Vretimale_9827, partial [Volvox reticuliferus]
NDPVRDPIRRSKAEVTAAAAIAAAAAAAAAAAMMTRRSTTVRPKLYAELLEVARRGQATKPSPKPSTLKSAAIPAAVRQGSGPRSASKAGLGSGSGFEAPPDSAPDFGQRRANNPACVTAATPRPASIRAAVQAASPAALGDPLVTARWDGGAAAAPPTPTPTPAAAVTLTSAAAVTKLHPPWSPAAAVRSALPAYGSGLPAAAGSKGAFTRQDSGPGMVSESLRTGVLEPRQGPVAAPARMAAVKPSPVVPLPVHQIHLAPADANLA